MNTTGYYGAAQTGREFCVLEYVQCPNCSGKGECVELKWDYAVADWKRTNVLLCHECAGTGVLIFDISCDMYLVPAMRIGPVFV